MTRLVTWLDGMPVVLERRPSGVGTWLWVGEFRTRGDRPMRARAKNGAAYVCEVRCGRTIEEVLTALRDTATRLVDKPGRVA